MWEIENAGFDGEVLGEETIDGARALPRKYGSKWEIRADKKGDCFAVERGCESEGVFDIVVKELVFLPSVFRNEF